MSYFRNGVVYIIVPDADITNEMENNAKKSFDVVLSTMRTSTDDETLFKIKIEFVGSAFNSYAWYNREDILVEMEKTEWAY